MVITPAKSRPSAPRRSPSPPTRPRPPVAARSGPSPCPAPRRIAANFLTLSAAEIACRATSIVVTLSLAKVLGKAGYGRIEFAFNVVFWLVLLVRNGCDVIASRELARHPRLIRPLVDHLFFVKLVLAVGLFLGLAAVGALTLSDPADRVILTLYGLMLLTTAMGLDFVYRGTERVGLVAVSLYLRTAIYALGVWAWVSDPSRIAWVPAFLALGEASGIALVWSCYARRYGVPRPRVGRRFLRVFLRRCRPALLIQVSQTVLGSVDLMVVGLMCSWDEVGLYGAPHRMVMAVLTFGMIFQQVVLPSLARSWRAAPESGRRALDGMIRALVLVLLPLAVGTTLLAGPLVRALLPASYASGALLLAVGIWRAPLLTLAYLYQTALIASNREAAGVRLLVAGAIGSGPLTAILIARCGLVGASAASVATAAILVVAGYARLAVEGRRPTWHHHLGRPLLAAAAMVATCLSLSGHPLPIVVGAGGLAYLSTFFALGGLPRGEIRAMIRRA